LHLVHLITEPDLTDFSGDRRWLHFMMHTHTHTPYEPIGNHFLVYACDRHLSVPEWLNELGSLIT
jgi:hypothetical protein